MVWHHLGILLAGGALLVGCAASMPPIAQAPLPADEVGWSAPQVVETPDASDHPTPSRVRPAGSAEKIVAFEEGTPIKVTVGVNQGLTLQFEPGEYLASVKGAYEGFKPEGDDVEPWKASIEGAGSKYPLVHLRATRPGMTTAFHIPTSQRLVLVEARSVHLSKTLVVRIPGVPAVAQVPPKPLSLLPDPTIPAVYHGGYTIEPSTPVPTWTPLSAVDDGRRTYVTFPRNLSVQAAPLARLLGANGPELINPVLVEHILVLDHLVPAALELRLGSGTTAEVVRITRGAPTRLVCPGDGGCPQWPPTGPRAHAGRS